ncbi:MAG TPA: nitroreductase family protein, partial [Rectinemataceae bacterium]|nr:nitroreductase family protein [Rectinemataceae bacterium]
MGRAGRQTLKGQAMKLGLESIRDRVSVRSYDGEPLGASEAEALRSAFGEAAPGPFGGRPRFLLLAGDSAGLGQGRIGTYGQIRGAAAYIVGAIARSPHAMEDFGYALEGIILRATELGLGTCWLGGLFARSAAARALGVGPTELIPACSPVGRAATRPGFQDRLIRAGAASRTRKEPRTLFYETGDGGGWCNAEPEGRIRELVEAVRVAPSASNRQPWRLLHEGLASRLHLFLD